MPPGELLIPWGVLLRAREYPFLLLADNQISLNPEDRGVTRFLWLQKSMINQKNIQIYRFQQTAFEIKSSPFILTAIIRYHLHQTETAKQGNSENTWELEQLATRIVSEDARWQFDTRRRKQGWSATSLPSRMRYQSSFNEIKRLAIKLYGHETIPENQRMKDQKTKVLGLTWYTKRNKWEIKLRVNELSQMITKRSILHMLASNFDHLGLIAPVFLKEKILFQDSWKAHCKCGEPLDKEYMERWDNLMLEWRKNPKCELVRYLGTWQTSGQVELYALTNASHATAIHIRFYQKRTWVVKLVYSKNWLNPTKPLNNARIRTARYLNQRKSHTPCRKRAHATNKIIDLVRFNMRIRMGSFTKVVNKICQE